MKRVKIHNEYYRSGYGRTTARKANVYLINGFLYAKDAATAKTQFDVLTGELSGYVRVNCSGGSKPSYWQVNEGTSAYKPHKPYKEPCPVS